ncbi:aspartate carbamoyltransferase [Persephonella hydrogeniphila]|uniref:Aspartate carbamoyltransferase n=1 Tax=Persephonella hydrogeniphila TaxID=198703 RepID=A0A285MYQ7_9AQUI|nr:aspartate carbamoyltransferase catalytic subunit [Persephonella hydrogeniphila]SNZ02325.1 aspartate carbamoyltransferase [Persephonella hydrogeniphila]
MKDFISVKQLDEGSFYYIYELYKDYRDRYKNGETKFSDLKGYSVLLPFFENSTRTRTSFELAGKILGADTINISASSSSVKKGETLYDTIKTLEAMQSDFIVLRHYMSGAAHIVANKVKSRVINAGDGTHEHPSQAVLDAITILENKGRINGLKVAIIGDILHSRVARSDIILLHMLGAEITVCGPQTMLPRHLEQFDIDFVTTDINEALKDKDVAIFLRIQLERQKKVFFSTLNEYSIKYGLNQDRIDLLKEDALIMHPGPVNRGVEIQSELVYGNRSVILQQVENGLFTRMAIYKFLLNQ